MCNDYANECLITCKIELGRLTCIRTGEASVATPTAAAITGEFPASTFAMALLTEPMAPSQSSLSPGITILRYGPRSRAIATTRSLHDPSVGAT